MNEKTINPNKAVDYLIENAKKFSQARAERIYLEEFRKSKKALLMKDAMVKGFDSVNAQEREAYAHKEYQDLLEGLKEAIKVEEELRWTMVAAQARIEIWRSMEATARNEVKLMT